MDVKKSDGKGMPFVYKGTMNDESQLLIPKGHIVITNDGTNGTCMYRSHFGDSEDQMPQVSIGFLLFLLL